MGFPSDSHRADDGLSDTATGADGSGLEQGAQERLLPQTLDAARALAEASSTDGVIRSLLRAAAEIVERAVVVVLVRQPSGVAWRSHGFGDATDSAGNGALDGLGCCFDDEALGAPTQPQVNGLSVFDSRSQALLRSKGVESLWTLPVRAGAQSFGCMVSVLLRPGEAVASEEGTALEVVAHLARDALARVERDRHLTSLGRMHLQRALRQCERQLETTIDALGDWLYIVDRESRIVFANNRWRDAVREYSRNLDTFGLTPLEALPFLPESIHEDLARTLETGDAKQAKLRCATPMGMRWIELVYRPVLDQAGQAYRVVVLMHDVTERERATEENLELQAKLQQTQKMEAIGDLAGGVAHDFNNLLTGMLGYANLALDGLVPHDPVRDDITQIRVAAERAASLTQQLLTLSRRQVIMPRNLDLNERVRVAVDMLGRLLGEDIELEVNLAARLGMVYADPHQMDQVLLNLVVNAREAMPTGGKLVIATTNLSLDESFCLSHPGISPGPFSVLAVSDTGIGIDASIVERLFEPFFSTKDKGQGTGLGLSIVYGIVRQNKGAVSVYSEVGLGTTLKVYLPQSQSPSQDDGISHQEQPEKLHGRETILLVEDEKMVRRLAKRLLCRFGYAVLDAACGAEALELAEHHRGTIDLLITDVVMPGMNGMEVYLRVQDCIPDVKVLFMSGYPEAVIAHHGVVEPGRRLLEKPFTPENLGIKVREALERTPA